MDASSEFINPIRLGAEKLMTTTDGNTQNPIAIANPKLLLNLNLNLNANLNPKLKDSNDRETPT